MKVLSKIMAVICVLIIGVATVGCSAIQYAKIGELSAVVAKAYTLKVESADVSENTITIEATIYRDNTKSNDIEISESCFTLRTNTIFNWKVYKAIPFEKFTLASGESKDIEITFESVPHKVIAKKLYMEFDLSDTTLGTFIELGVLNGQAS